MKAKALRQSYPPLGIEDESGWGIRRLPLTKGGAASGGGGKQGVVVG